MKASSITYIKGETINPPTFCRINTSWEDLDIFNSFLGALAYKKRHKADPPPRSNLELQLPLRLALAFNPPPTQPPPQPVEV